MLRVDGPAPVERAQTGWRLRLLYPLSGRVPALGAVPLAVRRTTRRTVTRAAVRLALSRCPETRFVGLTGAMGKTTAKDLLGAMLATAGPTLVTRENDNGIYGVPATLISVRPSDRFAVIETGIEAPGDMAWMSSLFSPELVIFTGTGTDHQRAFGSSAAVLAEKLLLLERLGPEGVVVVNADDPVALAAVRGLLCRIITAGRAPSADVRIEDAAVEWPGGLAVTLRTPTGRYRVPTQLIGPQLAPSVAFAFASAEALGVPGTTAALAATAVPPRTGRMQPVAGPNGSLLILDEHKSRPATALAAVTALGSIPASRRIAVLGELQEADPTAESYAPLGEAIARAGCSLVVAVGRCGPALQATLDPRIDLVLAERASDAADALSGQLGEGDLVLINGGTHQHLLRVALRLNDARVGCDVRLCTLHWRCTQCPHLVGGDPPAGVIEAA